MRAGIVGLASPFPLGRLLPSLYQEDAFVANLTAALDEVLAPVIATLDNLPAYLDPQLAPADFVEYLSGWVGVALDENWPLERRRDLVARAAGLYSRRGTRRALAEHVELYTGVRPEVEESGGLVCSATPGAPLPGTDQPFLNVRVRVPDPSAIDVRRLEAIVAEAKPVHIPAVVEVVQA